MILGPGIDSSAELAMKKARQGQKSQRAENSELDTSSMEATPTLGTSGPEVKPKQPLFAVGDTEAKLSYCLCDETGLRDRAGRRWARADHEPQGKHLPHPPVRVRLSGPARARRLPQLALRTRDLAEPDAAV